MDNSYVDGTPPVIGDVDGASVGQFVVVHGCAGRPDCNVSKRGPMMEEILKLATVNAARFLGLLLGFCDGLFVLGIKGG